MSVEWRWLVAAIALSGIAYGSLTPGFLRPRSGLDGHIEHMAAYFVAGLAALPFIGNHLALGFALVGLLLVAAVMEIAQLWIPGRSSRLTHFAASSAGVIAASLVGLIAVSLA